MIRRIVCLLLALLCGAAPCLAEESAPAEPEPAVFPRETYNLGIRNLRVYDRFETDTLAFTIESFTMEGARWVLTEIWVQDPARQIRKINAEWGVDLAAPIDMARQFPEAMLLTNASGYISKTYPDIPESYPGEPSDYYYTTLGSLVITEGEILRKLDGVPFYGLALSEDGISMYRGADIEDVLATQPTQTWAFFEPCAIQENGEEVLPEEGTWPMAEEKHPRTVLARINRNNYVLLHIPYGTKLRGVSLYRISEFFSEHFTTEWIYNLDGGYSSSLIYRVQKQRTNIRRVVPNVQKIADMLCFTE